MERKHKISRRRHTSSIQSSSKRAEQQNTLAVTVEKDISNHSNIAKPQRFPSRCRLPLPFAVFRCRSFVVRRSPFVVVVALLLVHCVSLHTVQRTTNSDGCWIICSFVRLFVVVATFRRRSRVRAANEVRKWELYWVRFVVCGALNAVVCVRCFVVRCFCLSSVLLLSLVCWCKLCVLFTLRHSFVCFLSSAWFACLRRSSSPPSFCSCGRFRRHCCCSTIRRVSGWRSPRLDNTTHNKCEDWSTRTVHSDGSHE